MLLLQDVSREEFKNRDKIRNREEKCRSRCLLSCTRRGSAHFLSWISMKKWEIETCHALQRGCQWRMTSWCPHVFISTRDVYSMFTEIGIGNAMTNECGFNVLLSSGDYEGREREKEKKTLTSERKRKREKESSLSLLSPIARSERRALLSSLSFSPTISSRFERKVPNIS